MRLLALAYSPAARRLVAAVALVGLTAAAVVLYRFDPAGTPFYPRCAFHALTGLHCPGCGSTRALHQLLHGRLGVAFGYNPLLVLALPYLGYVALSWARRCFGWRPWPQPFTSNGSIWALLGVVLLFWFLRNLPVAPFAWLAP